MSMMYAYTHTQRAQQWLSSLYSHIIIECEGFTGEFLIPHCIQPRFCVEQREETFLRLGVLTVSSLSFVFVFSNRESNRDLLCEKEKSSKQGLTFTSTDFFFRETRFFWYERKYVGIWMDILVVRMFWMSTRCGSVLYCKLVSLLCHVQCNGQYRSKLHIRFRVRRVSAHALYKSRQHVKIFSNPWGAYVY